MKQLANERRFENRIKWTQIQCTVQRGQKKKKKQRGTQKDNNSYKDNETYFYTHFVHVQCYIILYTDRQTDKQRKYSRV